MKLTFAIFLSVAFSITIIGCGKSFDEQDAINAQKELLELKYQHEIDLETLKQKGATALQQLLNDAALEQLRVNDSLTAQREINSKKQDYSVTVVDVFTNSPIADADVTVSSQGKVYATKTNAQGVATFTSLYLFPTSTFLISKTGYAATQILQQYITQGPAKLWNTSDQSNEISGTLFIETDLTNNKPENVGANVLVTASTTVPGGATGSYSVYFPVYTAVDGTYSLKLPPAPNGYNLTFQQIVANQKLYVNATEDDLGTSFPASLPRIATIKTYFNVNSFNASVPYVNSSYYFKFDPDNTGKILYLPGSNYSNQVFLSATNPNKYQVEYLNVSNYIGVSTSAYTYTPSSQVNVELVDITGNIIQTAPKLMAQTTTDGKIYYYGSQEGGFGYVHLRRDKQAPFALVDGAKGVILQGTSSYYNNYYFIPNQALNTATAMYVSTSLPGIKGDKRTINYYYGYGFSREKQVY